MTIGYRRLLDEPGITPYLPCRCIHWSTRKVVPAPTNAAVGATAARIAKYPTLLVSPVRPAANMRPSKRPTIATTKVITIIDPIENTSFLDLRVGVTKFEPALVRGEVIEMGCFNVVYFDCRTTGRDRQPDAADRAPQKASIFVVKLGSTRISQNSKDTKNTHFDPAVRFFVKVGNRAVLPLCKWFGTAFALLFFRKWFVLHCESSEERNRDEAVPWLSLFSGNQGRNYKSILLITGRFAD